jgi:hypothetical protein
MAAERTNVDRVECAAMAIEAYLNLYSNQSGDEAAALTDLLADLRHWAKENNISFDHALDTSEMLFNAECAGEWQEREPENTEEVWSDPEPESPPTLLWQHENRRTR